VQGINEWWQNLVTTNEIAVVRAAQEAQFKRIEEAAKLNQQIFGLTSELFQDVRGRIGESAAGEVPEEFDDIIDLFAEGGPFSEGAKAEISRGQQQALAAGQIGLASTGMSSGTNVAGLHARTSADAALARAKVEDERVRALAGGLEAKGTATLASRELAQRREATLLGTLTDLKPNFVG
jgi:hypothetical protein